MDTLGVCELVAGATSAWPKPGFGAVAWLDGEVDVVVVVDAVAAVLAAWLEWARPTAAAKATAEPNTRPRLASAARLRAMLIGIPGIDGYGITSE
ncbi:MAG TPA: hypothetical protein VIJ20_13560 [Solirubrobacteraceae bacterium]